MCLSLMRKVRAAPNQRMEHSRLLKQMHIKANDFRELVQTLTQRGEITTVSTPRAGSSKVEYQAL